MIGNRTDLLGRVARVMRQTFSVPPSYAITERTTSMDVDGWDSLSHAVFIMNVEREFNLELPIDDVYALSDIGALLDLLVRMEGFPRT